MKTAHVRLESPVSASFRCQRAADSLDIDTAKKAVHELTVSYDIDTPWNVGVIVGASGSGKTTLARQMFGDDIFDSGLDPARPIIEQFPADWSYDDCASALAGVGLTAVPCWIRPVYTLSNGQKARAEAALLLARVSADAGIAVVDEWTSVVDRTVAKVMSHCVQKHARRSKGRIILLSCHYDVLDWINPDWVIDCNTATYLDRRSLCRSFERSERLVFDVAPVDRATWRHFSKYHYLSERLPGGLIETFGVFHDGTQVGFQCFANYKPEKHDGSVRVTMHSNRTVIHPDYAGLGLGIKVIDVTSGEMFRRGYKVMAKFSSTPVYRAMSRDPNWRLLKINRKIGKTIKGGTYNRETGFRENVKTFSFLYVGGAEPKGV